MGLHSWTLGRQYLYHYLHSKLFIYNLKAPMLYIIWSNRRKINQNAYSISSGKLICAYIHFSKFIILAFLHLSIFSFINQSYFCIIQYSYLNLTWITIQTQNLHESPHKHKPNQNHHTNTKLTWTTIYKHKTYLNHNI